MPLLPPRRRTLLSALFCSLWTALAAQTTYTPLTVEIGSPITHEVNLTGLRQAIDPDAVSVTPAPRFVDVAYQSGGSFAIVAEAVGRDSIALEYCDATGACDTAYLAIEARLPRAIDPVLVYDTVGVPGSVKTFCLDTTELPGTVTTVRDLCEEPARAHVEFVYAEASMCIKYRGIALGGTDSTCYVVCDDLGFCDTTKIIVTTLQPEPFPDAALEFWIDSGQSDFTVLDVSEFSFGPSSLENTCPEASGRFVAFGLDVASREVAFEGLAVGTETACVLAKASNGTQKRYDVTVHVVTRTPGRDSIRIPVSQMRNWCFGAYELVGDPVGIFDACPSSAPLVTLETTADPKCLDITAAETVGFQELCVNLCDAGGRCDLVDLVVEVYEPDFDAPPAAVDDVVDVPLTNAVTYAILDNDLSDAALTSVRIVSNPTDGTARLDDNDRLVYDRDPGAQCGDDMLVYEICNANGCDRATVTLRPHCDGGGERAEIDISQAMSPNDDGVNDTWIIRNIGEYPDNRVRVFNRWGSRVFEASGYDNDWAGTFQDGKPLPDGTYFYHVILEDAPPITDYLEVRR